MAPLLGMAIGKVLERVGSHFFPDPVQRAEYELKVTEMAQRGDFKDIDSMLASDAGQVQVNIEEAKSDDIFKSGWRPYVGWVCGGGLSYQLMVRPVGTWVMENAYNWKPMPSLEMETLITLLFGLLGLGYYRTRERLAGKIQ